MATKFNDLLFSVKKATAKTIISPIAVLGQDYLFGKGATGSTRHPKGNNKMKMSRLLLAAEVILTKKVAALVSETGVAYIEYDSAAYMYDSGAGKFYTTAISSPSQTGLLATLFLSQKSEPTFSETFDVAWNMVEERFRRSGRIEPEILANLCDCFYYDLKAIAGSTDASIDVELFDTAQRIQVEQAIRTGVLHLATEPNFDPYLIPVFREIEYDGAASPAYSAGTTTATAVLDPWFEDCKAGTHDLGYEWAPEQQSKIRELSFLEGYVPCDAFRMLVSVVESELTDVIDRISIGKSGKDAIRGNYVNCILVGKPGTGKTTLAEALSATLGLPIYTIPLSKNSEEDEFTGKTKVVKGGLEFKSTPFLECFKNGGIGVFEEFNMANQAMLMGSIGQAIEPPFVLYQDGYEEIHRHPMSVFIFTMNAATQGASEPNEALTSRAPMTLIMDDPKKEDFIQILQKKGYPSKNVNAVYSVFTDILEYLKSEAGSEELCMCVTLRHCIGALKLMENGFSFEMAIQNTMVGSLAIRDQALANDVFTHVVKAKKYIK